MKVNTKMTIGMVKVNWMKEIINMSYFMYFDLLKQESFSSAVETHIKANGRMAKRMVKGKWSIHGGLLWNKVLGRIMSSKVEEYLFALYWMNAWRMIFLFSEKPTRINNYVGILDIKIKHIWVCSISNLKWKRECKLFDFVKGKTQHYFECPFNLKLL